MTQADLPPADVFFVLPVTTFPRRGLSLIKASSALPVMIWGCGSTVMIHALNLRVANQLREMARLLEYQGEGGFRSEAYRRAAPVVEGLDQPVDAVLASGGKDALVELPAIGRGIAAAIAEMVATGRWSALDRLTGELDPESLLTSIPGIGPGSAKRIHEELHVDTLEELEEAVNDGRLATLAGFGERRIGALRAALHERLRTLRGQVGRTPLPPVAMLLDIDRVYRRRAAANELKLIAPRRFNPEHLAWLPVMHDHRKGWHFTALFSNTARAHHLHKTDDWVIIHVMQDAAPDWQCTVVTETRGRLKGKRVVRGREAECEGHYAMPTVS